MTSLALTIGLLLGAAIVIYLACEYFVNGVEWVGRKLAVSQQATGSILAAFGTALPESVVTFVAVTFGASAAQKEIGVGAALGGPLVLSTIAYATVGITLLVCHQKLPHIASIRDEFRRLSRDQGWFLAIFVCKVALGLVVFAWKPWLGICSCSPTPRLPCRFCGNDYAVLLALLRHPRDRQLRGASP